MTTQVLVLEQFALTAPFGVRFWDVATSAPAEGGLTVKAYPDRFPDLRTVAIEGPSGVFSFSRLPGLARVENSAGDDASWAANPAIVPYTIQVNDAALRYLPFRFSVSLPVRGLFGRWDSPLSTGLTPSSDWLPIFSAPSRTLGGTAGSIFATLEDDDRKAPAGWALLTVQAKGIPPVTALANERGIVSLSQPYPEPAGSVTTSPLTAPNLTSQAWPVTVSVFYSNLDAVDDIPDLGKVLSQNEALVWGDTAHTFLLSEFQLSFGTELVLRSLDSGSAEKLPVLLVTSATSPL